MTAIASPSRDRQASDDLIPLIQQWVERTPDAPAIVTGPTTISYRQLGRDSDRLAAALVSTLGDDPDAIVPLALDRSPDLLVAMLAVWKAGYAYGILDRRDPPVRAERMLEDMAARLVVTRRELASAVPGERPAVLVEEVGTDPAGRLPDLDPDSLAYVLYTSGSTGTPKGVMVTHRAVANICTWHRRHLQIGPTDRAGQFHAPSFDASVTEIWPYLTAGASVHIVPDRVRTDPAALLEWTRRHRITRLDVATPIAELLLDDPGITRVPLRTLVTGGEVLRRRPPEGVPFQLLNLYGPAEATVSACHAAVEPGDVDGPVPVGHPIDNTTVRVLDRAGRPVLPGEIGELCLGGVGLARGYHNRPELTAAAFVPDRYADRPGARLYRTGDLAFQRPDGALVVLGRQDRQVKIRGVRVELSESEAALSRHPAVRSAVVVAVGSGGLRRLVGHVTCRPGDSVTEPGLREHLASQLPDYLVPARFVVHAELPLTRHGKVDRQRLVDHHLPGDHHPPGDRPDPAEPAATEPGAPVAEQVAAAAGSVLGGAAVDLDQPFAALGGHSLLAAQLVAELRRRLGVEIPVPRLLASESLRAFAADLGGVPDRPVEPAVPPLRPRPDPAAPAPLSFQQEEVWFLDQLVGGNRAYYAQATIHFSGELRADLLERAINQVIARHEVLRTRFVETADGPRQLVVPRFRFHLPVIDLSSLPADERAPACDQLLQEELDTGFDVSRLPLARWKLVRLAPDEHVLIQVDHHFVHDGWSETVLWQEIEACYAAWVRGQQLELAPLPIQYADYAQWQHERYTGEYRDASLRFWVDELRDLPPPLDLPFARPRPAQQTFRGGMQRIELDRQLYHRLRRFSRSEATSLFVTMYAAFAALISRYTGATDVLVASAFANRQPPATARLVGMLVNMVALRLRISPRAPFRALTRSAQQVVWDALAHQDAPFPEVVRAVQPARDPSRNPIAQISFSFHDSPMPELSWPGVSGRLVERGNQTAKFDLNLIVVPQAEQRAGSRPADDRDRLFMLWEYNTDLFDEQTVGRVADHYQEFLRAAIDAPDAPASALSVLPPAERSELIRWGRRTASYPGCDLATRFEEVVAAAPHRAAVTWLSETPAGPEVAEMSYADLDARANLVGHALRRRGVGAEEPVATLLPRGPDLVVAQLGALKAGAAYLPLDRSFPAERLAAMLRDAGGRVVVAAPGLAADDPELVDRLGPPGTVLTSVDELTAEVSGTVAGPPDRDVSPRQLACIMYTSGSTGQPKGVLQEHRGIIQLVCNEGYADFERGRRIGHAANPAFDAALFEIWGSLLHGGTVCVVGAGELLSPWELPGTLRRLRVAVLFLTTSLFHEIASSRPDDLDTLEQLLFGGEAADPAVVRALLARIRRTGRGPQLTNVYGPTEATSLATVHQVTGLTPGTLRVPIGRPIANASCYLLDAHFQPVPVGVVGDLYLAGPGLARGYLGDPGLTADSYYPDPITPGGGRMYRTGDRARWLPEGVLEFVSRGDEQIKVRGFRVEPAEIRAALLSQAGVAACAIRLWREDEIGRQALVAYLVPERPGGLEPEAVRAAAARQLPRYMVPTDVVIQDRLPLNSRGKVDHASLDPPGSGRARPAARSGATTPHERLLCQLWAELLELDRVEPDDDFYALGGHSLLAVRIAARLRHEHGTMVRVSQILDTPSLRELAQLAARASAGVEESR